MYFEKKKNEIQEASCKIKRAHQRTVYIPDCLQNCLSTTALQSLTSVYTNKFSFYLQHICNDTLQEQHSQLKRATALSAHLRKF